MRSLSRSVRMGRLCWSSMLASGPWYMVCVSVSVRGAKPYALDHGLDLEALLRGDGGVARGGAGSRKARAIRNDGSDFGIIQQGEGNLDF
jgi:hypothetical protein